MNCQKPVGIKMCGYSICMNKASCITTVFGFRVPACEKHHDCDPKWSAD